MGIAISQYQSNAISLIRIIAMISIVLCHFLQAYNNRWAWLLNVGVHIFLVLSGYLYGHKDITNWRRWFLLRLVKLYLPLYIYTTIAFSIVAILTDVHVGFVNYLKAGGVEGFGHLWFMKAIGVCYLTTPILQYLKRFSSWIFIVLVIVGLFEYTIFQVKLFTFSWLWLYSIGYFFPNLTKFQQNKVYLTNVTIVVIMSLFASWDLILNYDGTFNRTYHDMLGIMLCLGGIWTFSSFRIERLSDLLKIIDKNSFYLYITHHVYLIGSLSMVAIVPNALIGIPLILSLIVFTTILLSFISNWCIQKVSVYLK